MVGLRDAFCVLSHLASPIPVWFPWESVRGIPSGKCGAFGVLVRCLLVAQREQKGYRKEKT